MLLHKLCRATVNAKRTKLRGGIEVDEAWIGGEQKGLLGGRARKGRTAALAVFAVELRDRLPVRLRIKLVPDDSANSLVGLVTEVAEPGSAIITDGWSAHMSLPSAGFVHQRIVEGKGTDFLDSVPHVRIAIGNCRAWLICTWVTLYLADAFRLPMASARSDPSRRSSLWPFRPACRRIGSPASPTSTRWRPRGSAGPPADWSEAHRRPAGPDRAHARDRPSMSAPVAGREGLRGHEDMREESSVWTCARPRAGVRSVMKSGTRPTSRGIAGRARKRWAAQVPCRPWACNRAHVSRSVSVRLKTR